jgi:hypothetical protein
MTGIVSKPPCRWDDLDPSIQSAILEFYQELWRDNVIRICAKHPEKILSAHRQSIELTKETGYKGSLGYVNLDWRANDEDDEKADISIFPGCVEHLVSTISNIEKGQESPKTIQGLNFLFAQIASTEDNSEFVFVNSMHYHPEEFDSRRGCMVFYKGDDGSTKEVLVDQMPIGGITMTINLAECQKQEKSKQKEKSQELEREKETQLYNWLRINGIDAERQVKTSSNHFMDIWIPGKMMIEIKRGNVTANDVCQCIEYASDYKLPIVLIGEKISGGASRGLKGFNSLCPEHKIIHLSWDAAYDFLRSKLNIH